MTSPAMSPGARQDLLVLALSAFLAGCASLSPINAAARAGELERLRALLDEDARRVNEPDPLGWTPLHFAAQRGGPESVQLLLARGANPNARLRSTGGTVLHVAAASGNAESVALLLSHGAQPEAPDHHEWTPLHRAAIRGEPSVAESLLAAGANAVAWSRTNITPAQVAADHGHATLAELLLARGRRSLPVAFDFSGQCRWPVGDTSRFSYGCLGDAYRLHLNEAGPVHVVANLGVEATSVRVEVQTRVETGRSTEPGAALLGVGCMSERWAGYLAFVRTNGAWAIMRLEGKFKQLAAANAPSPRSVPADRPYALALECHNDPGGDTQVAFWVDGVRVGSASDPGRSAAIRGAALYADAFPGTVAFDDLVVRDLDQRPSLP
jgi:ankyrin repeat protein